MRGLFVSIEGIDGTGKTTQVRLLGNRLYTLGYPVVPVREPGGTRVGEKIREILKSEDMLDPMDNLLLFTAARRRLFKEVIQPGLKEGNIVISDRFIHSTLAYQGYAQNLGTYKVSKLTSMALGEMCWPDVTIVLSLPVEEAIERARQDRGDDAIKAFDNSGAKFMERVQTGFHAYCDAGAGRVFRVDASGGADDVHQLIMARLEPALVAWKADRPVSA